MGQHLEPLASQLNAHDAHAGTISRRAIKACAQSSAYRITADENNRDRAGRRLCRTGGRYAPASNHHGRVQARKLVRQSRQSVILTPCPAIFDRRSLAIDVAECFETLKTCRGMPCGFLG